MADTKISALSAGGTAAATDRLPAARAGANVYLTPLDLLALANLFPGSNLIEQRNGTSAQAFRAYNTYTDASNYEYGALVWSGNTLYLQTVAAGTGGSRDIRISPWSGNTIVDNSNLVLNGSGKTIGYGSGSGGAVTQLTSRTTGVTLNKGAGAITLFTAAGSATPASFTVTNSAVAATDVINLSVKSATTNKYVAIVTAVAAGSFEITFWAASGTTSDAPVFNFAVLKAVAA